MVALSFFDLSYYCIYVTHDQVEAFSMSDRIMIMEKGSILQFATPVEIRTNPINDFVKDLKFRF